MTYDAYESSVEAGRPVELYHFSLGTRHYYYTSAEDTVVFGGNVYLPRQIERTAARQADGERRHDLKITLPSDDPVCTPFIGIVPGQPLYLTILRFHRGDNNAENHWTGRVISATFKRRGAFCELNGMTSEAAFNRPIPRFKYQGLCNHVLYDGNCSVDKDSFKFTGTVTDVTGNTITIIGLSAQGAGWALGGYVSNDEIDFRAVVGQTGDVLTLELPFSANVLNTEVDVYAGCDHTLATCNSKFSNAVNYGGFAFVPALNPFNTGLR